MFEFLLQYRIEPRCDYYGHDKWLVVYDKKNKRYYTEMGHKNYKQFRDTDEIVAYFRNQQQGSD